MLLRAHNKYLTNAVCKMDAGCYIIKVLHCFCFGFAAGTSPPLLKRQSVRRRPTYYIDKKTK
jgi:hypothetical protein